MSDDSIGRYYDDCRKRRDEALRELDAAIERGADWREIQRLRERVLDEGNTGD